MSEALDLLAEFGDQAKIIAGGQSLLPLLALRLAQPEHLIDIGTIHELSQITAVADGVRLGAAVTQRDAERSSLVDEVCPVLAEAIRQIGHPQTRARGTVCGSLAHADPAAELPALALALDASFTISSPAGVRSVDARDFFQGFLSTAVGPNEILTAVTFPRWVRRRGAAVAEVGRRSGDFALIGIVSAVALDDAQRIEDVRIAVFGAASRPVRLADLETKLVGMPADMTQLAPLLGLGDLQPVADLHGTSAYRTHLARGVMVRALRSAIERARGSEV